MTCRDCSKYETCPAPPPGGAYGMAETLTCFNPGRQDRFGKWVVTDRECSLELVCPVCGFMYAEADPNIEKGDIFKYCPECGANNE